MRIIYCSAFKKCGFTAICWCSRIGRVYAKDFFLLRMTKDLNLQAQFFYIIRKYYRKGDCDMPRTDILQKKEEILQWISEQQSKAYICRQLSCKPETLNSYLKKMGIEYKGNPGSKGKPHTSQYMSALEYSQKSHGVKSHILKQKLLFENIREYKCEICGLSEWMGQPIPLELHHIDNDHYNNSLSNVIIICPNCHAQQPGKSGANANKNAGVLEQEDNSHLECEA